MRGIAIGSVMVLVGLASAAPPSARQVIEEAQARNGFATWHDRRSVVTLEGFDGDTRRVAREAEVLERADPRGAHRTLMRYLAPADFRDTRYLHVSPRGARQEWWTWTPAARRARKLGGTYPGLQRDEIFFATDLSYSDLVVLVRIQQWTDADGTMTLDDEEPCGAGHCDRIALVPARDNAEFPCAGYRLWFSRDDRLLRKAELDDAEGRLMKTITCDDYFATARFMTARRCVIEHVKTQTRSVITVKEVAYDTGLGEDLFTVAHLADDGG